MAAAPPIPMPAGTQAPAGLAGPQTATQAPVAAPQPVMPAPAAPTNQLSAFGTAQATTDAQRQALLAAVAQSGAAGAAQYQTAQDTQHNAQSEAVRTAMEIAQGSPLAHMTGGYDVVTDPVNNDFIRQGADLDAGRQAFSQDIARQQAAGQQYFGQLSQAIPLVESRTRAQVEQIMAEERQAAQARAMQMAMSQLDLQSQREQIAAQREARDYDRQERQMAAKTGGRDPLETRLMEQELRRGDLELEDYQTTRDETRRQTAFEGVVTRFATGEHAGGRAQAIEAITNAGEGQEMILAMQQVFANADQYGIDPSDQHAIMDAVNAYREAAGMEGSLRFSEGAAASGNSSRAPRRRNTETVTVAGRQRPSRGENLPSN